ncbi:MAG: alpha/beta hydrolase [Polyangiales bacterium]
MDDVASGAPSDTGLTWTQGIARANGIDIAWEQAGPEHGEPLLLIMGLGRQLITWPKPMCEALVARGMRLIRFDNRDIGLSGSGDRGVRFDVVKDMLKAKVGMRVAANYTLHDMTEDTLQLLDALGLERVHVAGVSMGGMIAQLLASKHADRVRSLTSIMSNTNHPWLPSPAWAIMRHLSAPIAADCPRDVAIAHAIQMGRLIGSPAFPKSEATLRAEAERAFDRAFRPEGGRRQSHGIIATGSIEDFVKTIRAPTQVIHGSADRLVRPQGGERTAKLVRDSRLTMIEGMGHDLPEGVLPRLVALIADNVARA